MRRKITNAVLSLAVVISTVPVDAAVVFTNVYGSLGSGSGQFNSPSGVATDSTGKVVFSDTGNNRLGQFDPANFSASFTTYGSAGSGSGQFNGPLGVAVAASGPVYVADNNNGRLDSYVPSNFAGTFTPSAQMELSAVYEVWRSIRQVSFTSRTQVTIELFDSIR